MLLAQSILQGHYCPPPPPPKNNFNYFKSVPRIELEVNFTWQSCLGLKNRKINLKKARKLFLQSGWNGLKELNVFFSFLRSVYNYLEMGDNA